MSTLIEHSEQLFQSALETMKKKNADYSGDNKSLKNFQISANIANVDISQGILVRLCDKVTRIGNLIQKDPAVKSESIFDTIQDLVNYAAILHYSLVEKMNQNKETVGGRQLTIKDFTRDT